MVWMWRRKLTFTMVIATIKLHLHLDLRMIDNSITIFPPNDISVREAFQQAGYSCGLGDGGASLVYRLSLITQMGSIPVFQFSI